MKNLILLFVVIVAFGACTSSTKYLQQGNYDEAVSTAVEKLQKKRTSEKDIMVLERAYPLANDRDAERIKFLKLEGRPDVYDEIFALYLKMKQRQTLVRTVLPLQISGRTIDFPVVDYDREIIEAKVKAAEYFYNHGKQLMQNNDKQSNREAYAEFERAKQFNPNYADIAQLMQEARYRGTTRAFLKVENNSNVQMPAEFYSNIINFGMQELNSEWVNYFSQANNNTDIDYIVTVNVKAIRVSPESVNQNLFEETREVNDGWEYQLDQNGNVMKDSLGNDIKRVKTKLIRCQVRESIQRKSVLVEGQIEYLNRYTQQIEKTERVSAESHFEHVAVSANGDLEALRPETRRRIGIPPVPFPDDVSMIFDAGDILRNVVLDALRANRNYVT